MTALRTILLGLALGLAACAAPVRPGDVVVEGGRQVPASEGTAQLSVAEREAARTFVAVARAVEPIAESECISRAPRADCDYRIVVDDRPDSPPNAFQTVDRRGRPIIAFTLTLIRDAENADEMAFVMAHEAAHHILGHLDRQRETAILGATVFGQIAGAGGATPEAIRRAQELGAVVGARTYSREFELEADGLGTYIAARAGFDPVRGAGFFLRLPDPGDQFLGSHPPNAERLALVRRVAVELGVGTGE